MKQQIIDYIEDLEWREQELYKLQNDYQNAVDKITDLQQENKQLKAELELYKDNQEYLNNKIDKAIEYIKTQVHRNQQFYEMDKDNLLEILGDINDI